LPVSKLIKPTPEELLSFDSLDVALDAAAELQRVLAARTHRKKVLGQIHLIPGQLGAAIGLPTIISKMQSKQAQRRADGLAAFNTLWVTLSKQTRRRVLDAIGWYDPEELDWEDKRSNLRPRLNIQEE
jgi:hypothetical protein